MANGITLLNCRLGNSTLSIPLTISSRKRDFLMTYLKMPSQKHLYKSIGYFILKLQKELLETTKEKLYHHCSTFINDRLHRIQQIIADIQESLTTETKSTVGDKHETGRAMLQLEREKAGKQLAEVQKLQEVLSKIDINKQSKIAHLGSIIYTTKANYFLSISAGKCSIDTVDYYTVAPNSPVGKLLLGKENNDTISLNDQQFTITEIV